MLIVRDLVCSWCTVDGPFFNQRRATTESGGAPAGHPERTFHSFVAGCIGGYCVWGNSSSINNQILLYLISRIQMGLVKKAWERWNIMDGTTELRHPHSTSILLRHPWLYRAVAATTWGMVMALFEDSPHVLHSSLRSSMDEIYRYPSLLSPSSSSLEDPVTTTTEARSRAGYDDSIPQ
jgi:hypothetical protein